MQAPLNQQTRRKPSSHSNINIPVKVPSTNSLLSNKQILIQRKISDGFAKQNQYDKNGPIQRKNKQHTIIDQYEDKSRKKSSNLNFKALGKTSNLPKQQKKNKQKKDKQCFSGQMKQKVVIADTISINFNIQNMIQTKKSESKQNQSNRSIIIAKQQEKKRQNKQQKDRIKKKQKSNFTLDDFQCDQIIEIQPLKSNRYPQQSKQQNDQKDTSFTTINTSSSGIIKTNNNYNQKNQKQKTFQQQLKAFADQQKNININAQVEELVFLNNREQFYSSDPMYIEKKQKHFTWIMRSILIEWMMHVCTEYRLKRQTYHIAVVLTDSYLQKITNIPKSDFQLVGAAAMYVAAKIQQQQPLSAIKFVQSTTGKYTPNAIIEMQTKLCKTLKWYLNPPTINMWANKIMLQWDLFIEQNQYGSEHQIFKTKQKCYFKKSDQVSYQHFREVMQLIDCSILDVQSFQYKPKLIVCSFLYLVLGKYFQQFNVKQITTQLPRSSLYILNEEDIFNDLFKYFVEYTFGFLLFDLLPTVQYCATYFHLPLSYEIPELQQLDKKGNLNYQDFSSYQTYNRNHLATIKRRNRGIIDAFTQ